MRHITFRLLGGAVWFCAAIANIISGNLLPAGLYALLGAAFLGSAWMLWTKNDRK